MHSSLYFGKWIVRLFAMIVITQFVCDFHK
jgi:hypothetical protein